MLRTKRIICRCSICHNRRKRLLWACCSGQPCRFTWPSTEAHRDSSSGRYQLAAAGLVLSISIAAIIATVIIYATTTSILIVCAATTAIIIQASPIAATSAAATFSSPTAAAPTTMGTPR
jgi:hypothetical protein